MWQAALISCTRSEGEPVNGVQSNFNGQDHVVTHYLDLRMGDVLAGERFPVLAAGAFTGRLGEPVKVGKLGVRKVTRNVRTGGTQVVLGPLDIYTKDNVDHYIAIGG